MNTDVAKMTSNLRFMVNAMADEYPRAIKKHLGKTWLSAFRSYLDLVDCQIDDYEVPPAVRNACMQLRDRLSQKHFLRFSP